MFITKYSLIKGTKKFLLFFMLGVLYFYNYYIWNYIYDERSRVKYVFQCKY